jgi:hypothetical protein
MKNNMGESVTARLKAQAKEQLLPVDFLRVRYMNERLMGRWALSEWRDKLALKGGMMIPVWSDGDMFRHTADIDMGCLVEASGSDLLQMVRDLAAMKPESQGGTLPYDDGLIIDPASVKPKREVEGAVNAIKVTYEATLHTARMKGTIDITSKTPVVPGYSVAEYPCLFRGHKKLPMPAPEVTMYPPETTIAEKFHAMAQFGSLNERIKDYYDMFVLLRRFEFDDDVLATALQKTFEKQGRAIPNEFAALSDEFVREKESAWREFNATTSLRDDIPPFGEIVKAISEGYGEALERARNTARAAVP